MFCVGGGVGFGFCATGAGADCVGDWTSCLIGSVFGASFIGGLSRLSEESEVEGFFLRDLGSITTSFLAKRGSFLRSSCVRNVLVFKGLYP